MPRKTLGMSQCDIKESWHLFTLMSFQNWLSTVEHKRRYFEEFWKLTSFGSQRFPLYGPKKQIFQNIFFCVQRFEMTREQVVDDNFHFWVGYLFNQNQTKRWWEWVEMDSDSTLWCKMRAAQSEVPWANQSQSNTASFSQCLTAFGAFQSLQKRYNVNQEKVRVDTLIVYHSDWSKESHTLTVIKPAIFKAVKWVEQRHVQETDQLTNSINGEETHNPSLKKQQT